MFSNVFCFLCFNFAVFCHHDSPHRLPRPLARSSPPLCLMSSMASLYVLSGVLFLDVVGQASCSRPFPVVAVSGRPLREVFAGSSISCLHQAQNVFVFDGRGESTHIPPNPSSQLPPAGHRWLDRDRKALVVVADRGFRRVWRLQNRLRRLTLIHRIRTRG